jgi:hypothetical protein
MQYGDSVPTGAYLDMTVNLPVVDPMRGLVIEHSAHLRLP